MRSKQSRDNKDELYNYLCKINDYLQQTYPKLNFSILNLETNNKYKNYKNIINLNIEYNLQFSNNGKKLPTQYYKDYRDIVDKCISTYIKQPSLLDYH